MCRPLCDGGRRCTSSKGEHRRAGDRARYAAAKAAALPTVVAVVPGAGEPEMVDGWELAKDRIAELTALIRADPTKRNAGAPDGGQTNETPDVTSSSPRASAGPSWSQLSTPSSVCLRAGSPRPRGRARAAVAVPS